MGRIVAIFKKDVTHLWPQILMFLAALIVFACEDPGYVYHRWGRPYEFVNVLFVLLPVSCWLLVTSLFQAEKTVGQDQYWLTRPIALADLLTAKALFLVLFLIVPVYICQIAVLSAIRFMPPHYVAGLLLKQLFFIAWFLLPTAAIASVTKNLAEAFVGLFLILLAFVASHMASIPDWYELGWIRETAAAFVTFCGTAAVVYLQYLYRLTYVGRAAIVGVTVLVVTVMALPPQHWAFVIQSWFSEKPLFPQTVRISFDSNPATARKWIDEGRPTMRLGIPFHLENRPSDLGVDVEWIRVEAPWKTSWSQPVESETKDSVAFEIPAESYRRFKHETIHVRGSLGLMLWKEIEGNGWIGRCRTDGWAERYCLSGSRSDSPFPTSPWFGPVTNELRGNDSGPVSTTQFIAHIQRPFDIGPMRLADYVEMK